MRWLTARALIVSWALAASAGAEEAVAPSVVVVEGSSAAASADEQRYLLDLCLNNQCQGIATVIVRGALILVEEEALARSGLPMTAGTGEMISGHRFQDASALAPGGLAVVNLDTLRLELTLPGDSWPSHLVDLAGTRPQLRPGNTTSAFLSYALNADSDSNRAGFFDAGLSHGTWLLRSTFGWRSETGMQRAMSELSYDDPDRLLRWSAGDQLVHGSDGIGGGVLLGGLSVRRAFEIDPYLVTFPQPQVGGVLESPGTIEVYANGALIARREVQPGPFTLTGLGLSPGRGDLRVVVRDAFGGERLLTESYYVARQALRAGMSEFSYSLGYPRAALDQDRYDRQQPTLMAFHRYGFTDWLTAGYRVEANRDLRNLGLTLGLRLPVGALGGAVAHSQGNGHSDAEGFSGEAAEINYQFSNRHVGISAGLREFSAGYRRLGEPEDDNNRLLRDAFVGLSWAPSTRMSLQVNASQRHYLDQHTERVVGVGASVTLGQRWQLQVNAHRRSDGTGRQFNEGYLSLNLALGASNFALSAQRFDDRPSIGAYARRSLPAGTGFGYAVDAISSEGDKTLRAELDYQNDYARFAFSAQNSGGYTRGNISVLGSFVAIGGDVFATRPLGGGFALVEVPGLANVAVLRENQVVGHTDGRGRALVTELLPYHSNKLGIDQNDVPPQYNLEQMASNVAVARQGGAIVRFEATLVRAAYGRLIWSNAGAGQSASGGNLSVTTRQGVKDVIVDREGRFYFEDAEPGTLTATWSSAGVELQCVFVVPETSPGMVALGDVACRGPSP